MGRERYHYKLIQELGRGSAGVIFLALDVAENRLVALKYLSPEAVDRHPNAVARFQREVRILSRLSHPNLVGIHRCGRSNGRPYFAMEYVQGRSLADVLQAKTLTVRQALRMTEKLGRALDHVHKRGIVHRDVKPSNILVDDQHNWRLVDFGLAHDESEEHLALTASGVAVGTLRYSSPEQCGGASRDVDGRADLYALGLILASSVTGVIPTVPETLLDLRERFEREFEGPMNRLLVPEDVIEVCRKATRYEAKARYRSARELVGEVHEILRSFGPSQRLAVAS